LSRAFAPPVQLWTEGRFSPLASNEAGLVLHTTKTIESGTGDLLYKKSSDQGATWGSSSVIATSISGQPLERSLYASANFVHTVFERNEDLIYLRSTTNGDSWESEVTFHTGTTGQFYRMAFGGSGANVYVVYSRINNGSTAPFWRGQMYFRRSTDNGATWSAESEIYPNGGSYESASRPNMAVNKDGSIIHICWAALLTGDTILSEEEINTGRSVDGGVTWDERVVQRASSTAGANRPEIYATDSGVLNLFWQEGTNITTALDLYTRRSTDNGGSWSAASVFVGGTGNTEHIYTHARGERIVAAWTAYPTDASVEGDGRLDVRYSEDGGATWSATQRASATVVTFAPVSHISRDYVHLLNADFNTDQQYFRAPWLSRLFRVTVSADDGYASRESSTPGEWPVTGAFGVSDSQTFLSVRKFQAAGFSDCTVSGIRFDTSDLPDDAIVIEAILRLQTTAKGAATGRSIQVGYYAPANWPFDSADWSGDDNPGSNAGTFPISDFAVGTEENLVLSSPVSVAVGGYTGFRLSVSDAEPTLNDDHRVEFASFDHATVQEPQLLVTFVIPQLAIVQGHEVRFGPF
jgi:hypothetical protein